MKKKLYSIFSAILIAMMVASPAGAGGVRITFGLKSLVADITAWGIGSTDYTFQLDASGFASVVCTNYGGNQAPGRDFPHVDATDTRDVPKQDITKNGKVILSLEAIPELEANPVVSGLEGGCPNSNWTARVDFVFWQTAVVQIVDTVTGNTTTYNYTCVTTRTGPNSTPSTFDDGTVSCTRVN